MKKNLSTLEELTLELVNLQQTYDFKCIINYSLIQYNLKEFEHTAKLNRFIEDNGIDMIEITSGPTCFRINSSEIQRFTIDNGLILIDSNYKEIGIMLNKKK